ncbi:MAG TPA: hypothetical protein VJP80_03250 [Candidatus Saccharimonadales bacterium]|nr:hypothetical protein [Candidatus Saccharimonadales bacterium]
MPDAPEAVTGTMRAGVTSYRITRGFPEADDILYGGGLGVHDWRYRLNEIDNIIYPSNRTPVAFDYPDIYNHSRDEWITLAEHVRDTALDR